jgi:tRNA (guanine-N7-)-methyltransferase
MTRDAGSDGTPPPPHKKIRSFVLRAGRTTAAQARAWQELWPIYGVDLSAPPVPRERFFPRESRCMVEIGFGAGEALLAFAEHHPEYDCLGIEVHRPGVGHLLLRAEAAALTNLRVACHDAVEVLEQHLAADSIDLIHVFFPDPWPKKRHHKRRLLQPPFVALLARALRVGGQLRVATDWQPYAEHIHAVLSGEPLLTNLADDNGFAPRAEDRPLTRFERRGQRLGHEVFDLAYARR